MAPHQHKKAYAGSQPSITSYFAPTLLPTNTAPHIHSISQQYSSPPTLSSSIPTTVQSNLLSVGMRVRKSVPEGYKTGTYSTFTLFSDVTPAQPTAPTTMHRVSNITTRPRARELTPFCGLHSVGGLALDESQNAGHAPLEISEYDDIPGISQSSRLTKYSIATPGSDRKRRVDFDEEDEHLEAMNDRTMTFGGSGRLMAVPRSKRKDKKFGNVRMVGQENADDFEDAEFLDYGLIEGEEVEMGGA
ncbi:ribonucleotide reductase inhibitor-domain-containing protein [Calycina marina]|uniref:Ribonucleotide reductase inhibitor-domain-containing protein n=1 Tax=Calycina marina TaxID=1763456 RepID=A0A9P7Z3D9_9HELO|nr:ribonucleotide reductase inhibitor-domain-containing protein [Calycina marina]